MGDEGGRSAGFGGIPEHLRTSSVPFGNEIQIPQGSRPASARPPTGGGTIAQGTAGSSSTGPAAGTGAQPSATSMQSATAASATSQPPGTAGAKSKQIIRDKEAEIATLKQMIVEQHAAIERQKIAAGQLERQAREWQRLHEQQQLIRAQQPPQQQQHRAPSPPPPPPPVNAPARAPPPPANVAAPAPLPPAAVPAPPPLAAAAVPAPPAQINAAAQPPAQTTATQGAGAQLPVLSMVASLSAIESAGAAARDAKEDAKRVALPPLVAGKKSNPYDLPVPPKVDDALKLYKYVPYSAFTPTARLQALRSEDEMVMSSSGVWTTRSVSRQGERRISMMEWRAAARVVEDRIRLYHNEERSEMFKQHHLHVEGIANSHSWELAVEYDITQREQAAADVLHDLSTLDSDALMRLVLQGAVMKAAASAPAPLTPSRKRSAPGSDNPFTPSKRVASGHCFRCGGAGHTPATCSATSTSAGRAPAAILQGGKGKNTLLAPDGRQFCFSFARGTCNATDSCTNFHGCSVCGDAAHGAASCPRAGR